MKQLATLHGLSFEGSISREEPSQPSQLSRPDTDPRCDSVCDGSEGQEKPSQAFEPVCDGGDSSDGFPGDTETKLGMSIAEAVAIWTAQGKPVIYLGTAENCLDLEKLLSHRDINERHLAAIRQWLEERRR